MGHSLMPCNVTQFQNAIQDICTECVHIQQQAQVYADGDDLTDADVTQAVALLNSVRSVRKLFEAINAA